MSKIIETPNIAMQHMRTYVKEVYQQSLMYYRDERRGNMVDKHQAHLAATLVKETSEYILNTSNDQLSAIKNNLLSVTSTLPESKTRPERQLELLLGTGATLFSLYNFINTQADNPQISRNKNSMSILTHIAEVQEDHLKHLEIKMTNNRYF
jgi:4-diphosphocytidyl-2C-methyl-D-erythritol kinase